jgi:peptide/nickel transport system permease protein
MIGFLVQRITTVALTALGSLLLVFVLIRVVPGDPVLQLLGDYASSARPEDLARIRASMGLDQPFALQFTTYAWNLVRGDFGESFRTKRLVMDEIRSNAPSTLALIAAGLSIAVLIGVPVGVYAATHRNAPADFLSMLLATVTLSSPTFWLGLLAIYLLSYRAGLFPIFGSGSGLDTLRYLVLPASVIGLTSAAFIARMTRSAMLEVLAQDYMRTASAKGLPHRVVLYGHGLRNAALPVITIVGLDVASLISSTVVIEAVFARPGMGKLVVDAMASRDYPVVQGVVVVFTFVVILVSAAVDMLYRALDPRLRSA